MVNLGVKDVKGPMVITVVQSLEVLPRTTAVFGMTPVMVGIVLPLNVFMKLLVKLTELVIVQKAVGGIFLIPKDVELRFVGMGLSRGLKNVMGKRVWLVMPGAGVRA